MLPHLGADDVTVTTPSPSMLYQIVGSKPFADPDDALLNASAGAKPNASPAPTMPIRKPRRDNRGSFKA
jgi:hypothetical protein